PRQPSDAGRPRPRLGDEAAKDPTAAHVPGGEPRLRGKQIPKPGRARRLEHQRRTVAAGDGRRDARLAEQLSERLAAHLPLVEHALARKRVKDVRVVVRVAPDQVSAASEVANLAARQERAATDEARDDEEVPLPPSRREPVADLNGALAAVVEGQQHVATRLT